MLDGDNLEIKWVYIVLITIFLGVTALRGVDRLSEPNFMYVVTAILTAVLSGTLGYYYARFRELSKGAG